MSSDRRIGKYREKSSRSRTPYTRPKGFMRRVTDSVSGLLGSSWIPGFLRGDEGQDLPQAGPSGYSRGATSNLQSSPRSHQPIYPEEAGSEEQPENSTIKSVVAAGAVNNASSNHRNNFSASAHGTSASSISAQRDGGILHSNLILGGSSLASDNGVGDRYTNVGNSSAAVNTYSSTPHSSQGGRMTYSTPTSQLIMDTATSRGVCRGSQLPSEGQSNRRPADFLSEEQPPSASQCHAVPSSSSNPALASRLCTPGGSMTSDLTASTRLSAAQSASKRPRFSLAAYSAAASPAGGKSILSDGSFRSSPFYPGRTIYGGAASYRRTPTPVTPSRASTASPRSNLDGGLSEAAKKILTCLNAMSTPLADAKRIPTPAASPYATYMDSPYTAAFHRHRPHQHRPPTSAICTPAKASVQSNFTQYVLPRPSAGTSSSGSSRVPEVIPASGGSHDHSVLNPGSTLNPSSDQPSIFSVAAASSVPRSPAASKFQSSAEPSSIASNNPLLHSDKPFVESGSVSHGSQSSTAKTASGAFSFSSNTSASMSLSATQASSLSSSSNANSSPSRRSGLTWPHVKEVEAAETAGGKIRPTFKPRHINRDQEFALPAEPPTLPNAVLPKVNFSVPIPLSSLLKPPAAGSSTIKPSEDDSRIQGYEFSVPEVLHDLSNKQKDTSVTNNESSCASSTINFSEDCTTMLFNFSAPISIITGQIVKDNFIVPTPSLGPKRKATSPVKVNTCETTRELAPSSGGLLDFLNKSSEKMSPSLPSSKDSIPSSSVKSISAGKELKGFGDRFKAASGSWECASCLVRNIADNKKCVACDTLKPGSGNSLSSSNSVPVVPSGFGDRFKAAAGSWECASCLVRNTADRNRCVACDAVKPGSGDSISNFGSKPVGPTNCGTSAVSSVAPASSTTAKQSFSGFGDAFKKAATDWECGTCLLNNKGDAQQCVACQTAKLGASGSAPASNADSFGTTSTGFSFGLSSAASVTTAPTVSTSSFTFGASQSSTVASTSASSTFSFGLKPSTSTSQPTSTFSFGVAPSSTAPTSTPSVTAPFSFGVAPITSVAPSASLSFSSSATPSEKPTSVATVAAHSSAPVESVVATKSLADWDCLSCLKRNIASSERCASCDAAKPGHKSPNSSSSTTSTVSTTLPTSGFGDKFKKSAGDWECGVCMVNNKAEAEKCISCEAPKTGSSGSIKSSLGGAYKFGSINSSAESSGFKFGLKTQNQTPASQAGPAVPPVTSSPFAFGSSVSSSLTSASSSSVSAGTLVANIATSSIKAAVTIGTQPNSTSNGSIHEQGPPASLKFLSPSNETKVVKVKPAENSSSFTAAFKTGSELPNLANTDFNLSKSNPGLFTFGAPSNKNDEPAAATPSKTPLLGPSIPDSNKAVNFFNSTPAMNSSDTVNANNKRSLKSDEADSASKQAKSPFCKNNGFAEPSSQFSFGKSPSAVTPSFQFNSNNNKNTSAFGNLTSCFGGITPGGLFPNINNNSINEGLKPGTAPAQTFAFGQPAEKKASAGFDFGQATAPAFNFTASNASFQFGQAPNTKPSSGAGGATNNGIFQFGSGSAAAGATSGFSMSQGNPFSQTPSATPTGRLVKKAIRRTKK